ncbi:UPF0028 protein YchK [hydrothermal vent metagenome]|uniref:UPF0028 protein YchK n=1 Tax=hydrothermal vent metagenome TaxID=652676 RepID=A0A3B1DKK3_9ZZZZ
MSGLSSFINHFEIVKQIPIFSNLNWFDLQKITRKIVITNYRKGDVICKEGTPPDFFYCLISGRVQVYSINENEKKENVDFIHRGMYFGIVSLLTGKNHSLNFEAINDSVIIKILKEDFEEILKTIPKLGVEFSQTLSKRIRHKVKGTKSILESSIIAVYSPVKGSGSSTYAINLALSLATETKKKVLFIDIHNSVQKNFNEKSTLRWKTEPIHLNEVIGEHQKISDHIIKNQLSIDLLNVSFDSSDSALKEEISPFVSTLVGDYHYVVVDLPNEMDDVVLEAITQADIVHLITFDREKDLELIRHVVDRLETTLKENFQEEKICVIIRAFHAKIYLSFEEIDRFIDYHVHTMLPMIPSSKLKREETEVVSFLRCHYRSEYTKTITRLARQIGGTRVGLVLGGGAALGVAHIGVIRVLEEENIPIDIVVGSSMGALIGSMWTTGKNANELEIMANEFKKRSTMLSLFDPVIPISGLIGGRAIKRWLRKYLGNRTFYSTRIPFKIVAYDLIRREEIVLNGGPLVDAVSQSIAIPGVIEPIKNKEKLIIDGGVLNPLPTNVLSRCGIKKIIAVNVLQSPEDVCAGFEITQKELQKKLKLKFLQSPLKFLSFRFGRLLRKIFTPNISDIIVRTLQASEYVISQQSAKQADVTIHPDLVGINWFELYKVKELIKRGEEATRQALPEIRKLLEE